jgi:hypothetical protein
MKLFQPVYLMIFAFILLLVGWILPFLMVIHVIPSTFFLNFFSYTVSTIGLIVGVVGAVYYVRLRK